MIDQLLKLPGSVQLLFACLLGLVLFFVFRFLLPGISLLRRLNLAANTLEEIKTNAQGASIDPDRIAKEVMVHSTLMHLWGEFSETLHPQKELDSTGQLRTVRWRSTVPAETFFTPQTIVDIHLKTDYFKHSPGIMTGLGIIGTFFGLLHGLEKFKGKISDKPDEVREGLSNLLGGVSEAFIVSAIAILSAMVTTFIEKYLASQCYKRVEDLCQLIDGLYEAGVGEEYLAELLSAAKTSATQTTQLKDALVADLKEIMADLTRQHIEAIRQTSTAQVETTTRSGQDIADAILDKVEKAAAPFGVTVDRKRQVVDFGDRARFDTGSYQLTREQAKLLRAFVPKVLDIARDDLGKRVLKRIVVEGYTDQRGTYLYNLNLSMQRSQRVLCALLEKPGSEERPLEGREQEEVRELFLVGGYSFNSSKPTLEESRRIELRLEFLAVDETRPKADVAQGHFGVCAI